MTSLQALDSPLRTFFEKLAPMAGSPQDNPNLPEIADRLAALARDEDYFAHHMARLPVDRFAGIPLHAPERGPRLLLVHRPEGLIGAIHSHSVWVAIAPVTGTETHRRYEVAARPGGARARIEMTEERHVAPGEHVTLAPPRDIHAHGHGRGIGDPAYILILTGDDQFQYRREEFDAAAGTARTLEPGDRGS